MYRKITICSSIVHANGSSTLNALEWLPVRREWEQTPAMKRKRINRKKPPVGLLWTQNYIPLFLPQFHQPLGQSFMLGSPNVSPNSLPITYTTLMAIQAISSSLGHCSPLACLLLLLLPTDLYPEHPDNELHIAPAVRTFHCLLVTYEQNPVPTTDVEALPDLLPPPSVAHFTTSTHSLCSSPTSYSLLFFKLSHMLPPWWAPACKHALACDALKQFSQSLLKSQLP